MHLTLKYALKKLVENAITGNYSDAQLKELLRVCLAVARQLVHRKVASGKLRLVDIGLSEEDVTHDCVADLFSRDAQGRLTEFLKFVQSQQLSIQDLSEEMLFVHLRRLVFGAVSNNLFRLYNELDPVAGKIIRNLKIAVAKSARCNLVTVFDEHYLAVVTDEPLAHCRTISADELEDEVRRIAAHVSDIPSLLDQVIDFLISQTTLRRWVKLTSLAVAAKKSFEQLYRLDSEQQITPDSSLLLSDVKRIIEKSCNEISREMKPRYVSKEKLDGTSFENFMHAINELLCVEFVHGFDGDVSAYECFAKHNPTISRQEYFSRHRTIFEYLVKLTKQRTLKLLKED